MSPEELLRPRYKVIADYFYNPYKIGDIITVLYDDRSVHLTTTRYRDEFGETVDQANYYNPATLKDFPHLFQPLPWHVKRDKSELPMFLKDDERIWKIEYWETDMIGNIYPINEVDAQGETNQFCSIAWHFRKDKMLPASEQEYLEYIKQK